jgi:hypothetical protein
MFDRREVIVVNPEPVMARPVNPQIPLDTPPSCHRDQALCRRKKGPGAQQEAIDESADTAGPGKAVVSWTQIPEIWAALERRFL